MVFFYKQATPNGVSESRESEPKSLRDEQRNVPEASGGAPGFQWCWGGGWAVEKERDTRD